MTILPMAAACSIKYCLVHNLDASNFAWADGGSVQCYAGIEIYFASRHSASQWHLMQTHTRTFAVPIKIVVDISGVWGW